MTRADVVVLLAALALLPYLYARFWNPGAPGTDAEIWVDGKLQAVVSLRQDRRLSVAGALGTSVLEVRDGRLRFLSSPCQGKVCVHTGWLSHSGELAACLPNHVTAQIVGAERCYDAVSF